MIIELPCQILSKKFDEHATQLFNTVTLNIFLTNACINLKRLIKNLMKHKFEIQP